MDDFQLKTLESKLIKSLNNNLTLKFTTITTQDIPWTTLSQPFVFLYDEKGQEVSKVQWSESSTIEDLSLVLFIISKRYFENFVRN